MNSFKKKASKIAINFINELYPSSQYDNPNPGGISMDVYPMRERTPEELNPSSSAIEDKPTKQLNKDINKLLKKKQPKKLKKNKIMLKALKEIKNKGKSKEI